MIITWEMSIEPEPESVLQEEVATWPSEPYHLDWGSINWN
jgi:hypothetical protein